MRAAETDRKPYDDLRQLSQLTARYSNNRLVIAENHLEQLFNAPRAAEVPQENF